jgi:hypothetical protein
MYSLKGHFQLSISILALILSVFLIQALDLQKASAQEIKSEKPGKRFATVTMKDGAVYDVADWEFVEGTTGGMYYSSYDNYSSDYIPLHYKERVIVKFPIDQVKSISVLDSKRGIVSGHYGIVTLTNGKVLHELLQDTDKKNHRNVISIIGRVVVEGYPAAYNHYIETGDEIQFMTDSSGSVTAEVKQNNGSITADIREVKIGIDGGDSRSDSYTLPQLEFTMESASLEIPFEDVATLIIDEVPSHLGLGTQIPCQVVLRSGKTLKGSIYDYCIFWGKTTKFGQAVNFCSILRQIESIKFK